jgi:hypothetical protein
VYTPAPLQKGLHTLFKLNCVPSMGLQAVLINVAFCASIMAALDQWLYAAQQKQQQSAERTAGQVVCPQADAGQRLRSHVQQLGLRGSITAGIGLYHSWTIADVRRCSSPDHRFRCVLKCLLASCAGRHVARQTGSKAATGATEGSCLTLAPLPTGEQYMLVDRVYMFSGGSIHL